MNGHATPDEMVIIRALEAQIDPQQSPIADIVRLGQFYLCPVHDEERAMTLFKQALEREPQHPWATYWLAYLYYWDFFDMLSAKALLESWLASNESSCWEPQAKAAILQRLAEVRDSEDIDDLSDLERIALLEQSVQLASDWVRNRWYLARAYVAVGRFREAKEQLETAQANMIPNDPAWDAADDLFEHDVTGRVTGVYQDDIRRMLQELSEQP